MHYHKQSLHIGGRLKTRNRPRYACCRYHTPSYRVQLLQDTVQNRLRPKKVLVPQAGCRTMETRMNLLHYKGGAGLDLYVYRWSLGVHETRRHTNNSASIHMCAWSHLAGLFQGSCRRTTLSSHHHNRALGRLTRNYQSSYLQRFLKNRFEHRSL